MENPPQILPQAPHLPPELPPTGVAPRSTAKAKKIWGWVLGGSIFGGLAAIACVVVGFMNFSPEAHFARARDPVAQQLIEESNPSWEMLMQFGFMLGVGALAMFLVAWSRLRALRKTTRSESL